MLPLHVVRLSTRDLGINGCLILAWGFKEGAVGWECRSAGGAIAREKEKSGQEVYSLLGGDAIRVIREGLDNRRAILFSCQAIGIHLLLSRKPRVGLARGTLETGEVCQSVDIGETKRWIR